MYKARCCAQTQTGGVEETWARLPHYLLHRPLLAILALEEQGLPALPRQIAPKPSGLSTALWPITLSWRRRLRAHHPWILSTVCAPLVATPACLVILPMSTILGCDTTHPGPSATCASNATESSRRPRGCDEWNRPGRGEAHDSPPRPCTARLYSYWYFWNNRSSNELDSLLYRSPPATHDESLKPSAIGAMLTIIWGCCPCWTG
jgi:hypothetical protein